MSERRLERIQIMHWVASLCDRAERNRDPGWAEAAHSPEEEDAEASYSSPSHIIVTSNTASPLL